MAADVVHLARRTRFKNCRYTSGVVLDIQPIADVGAVAINRDRLSIKNAGHAEGYQLLRKVIGAVVVGTITGGVNGVINSVTGTITGVIGSIINRPAAQIGGAIAGGITKVANRISSGIGGLFG